MKIICIALAALFVLSPALLAESEEVEKAIGKKESKKNKKELEKTTQESMDESLKKRSSAFDRRDKLMRELTNRDK